MRQKLILLADKCEYGWKTVSDYLDNKLRQGRGGCQKRSRKPKKEAQRKLKETRNTKKTLANNCGATRFFQWQMNMGVSVFGAISTISTIDLFELPPLQQYSWKETRGLFLVWLAIGAVNAL